MVAEYESNLDGSFSRVLNQELYTVLASDEYIFALNNESVTRFNRTVSDKIHRRTNSFSGRHKNFIEALPERITEKNSEMYQYSENNSASELFYTEEYLESRGGSNVTINYAIPAASQNSSSDDVPDKLRELHNKVESINSEVESIKHSENQLTKEFVTKSEQQIFERELKNGIEQDIYLAGKRHGIY